MVQARVWCISMAVAMTTGKLRILQLEFPAWELRLLPGGKIGARPPKWADWGALGRRIEELTSKSSARARRRTQQ